MYICGMEKKPKSRKQILKQLSVFMNELDMKVIKLMNDSQLKKYSEKFI